MRRERSVLPLLAVAAAGAAVYVTFEQAMRQARARLAGRSQLAETSFGPIEYAEAGEGEPVLAIHGAGGGFDQGLDLLGELAGHGYRLIAPSRFGYLRSAAPDGASAAMQADAFAELLDNLGLESVAAIGVSAGAWSALQFAIRHPHRCRALVLIVPADALPPGTAIHGGAAARAIFYSDFASWAAGKLRSLMPNVLNRLILGVEPALVEAANDDEKARIDRIVAHLLPVSARAAGMDLDLATAADPGPYGLDHIACPVLAISAEDDRFGTARRARSIATSAPDATAIVYPSGGHVLVGRYSEALKAATAFLAAEAKARSRERAPEPGPLAQ